jgi:two-component system, response regulator YesN
MYKLVIADDEEVIREGLRDIVDWAGLGFELVAAFEDGQKIIQYIQSNSVDMVVTDIKMPKKSGLDIAEYVFQNNLSTKIILISGYKEIDLAMSAIKFNVQEYVLKPIDIDILTASITKVKHTLDKEYEAYINTIALELMEKSLLEIKDNFFSELMMASFKNEHYIKSMFNFLYPKLDIEKSKCFILVLSIENYDDFIANQWTHSNSDFYSCVRNCINLSSSLIEYRMITKSHNNLQVLGILTSDSKAHYEKAHNLIDYSNKNLCSQLKETLSCRVSILETEVFKNIKELLHNKSSISNSKMTESLMIKISELQKMIYSTICTGNMETALSVIKQFTSYMENLDISEMHTLTANLLVAIKNKLQESSVDISSSELYKEWDKEWNIVYSLKTPGEILTFLTRLFNDLIHHIKKTNINDYDIIEQAKKYIAENITNDFSLEDISEKFYMSQYYFSRVFKEKTGENFIDFVVRNKMEYAIKLLKMPQHKIYEISGKVGYKSIRYFTKTFKNYTGYTPTSFRKLLSMNKRTDSNG